MHDGELAFESFVFDTIGDILEHQRRRLHERWLPLVMAELSPLPGMCLAWLLANLDPARAQAGGAAHLAGLKQALPDMFDNFARERAEAAHGVMLDMARREAAEYWDAVTVAGLLAGGPAAQPEPTDREMAHLAGGRALSAAAQKSAAWFSRAALAALDGWNPGKNDSQLSESMAQAAKGWQVRLTTIARTLVAEGLSRISHMALSQAT